MTKKKFAVGRKFIALDAAFRHMGVVIFEVPDSETCIPIQAWTISVKPIDGVKKAVEDLVCCEELTYRLLDAQRTWNAKAGIAELPNGGALGARAARCLGMVTGCLGSLSKALPWKLHVMLPSEVEKALGIRTADLPEEERRLKRAELSARKKERARQLVLARWPGFKGWPEGKGASEHCFDAAAAWEAAWRTGRLAKVFEQIAAADKQLQHSRK